MDRPGLGATGWLVLEVLTCPGVHTLADIADEAGLRMAQVRNAIIPLREKGLIYQTTPPRTVGGTRGRLPGRWACTGIGHKVLRRRFAC